MNCLPNHFQMLNKQFEEIEYQHDIFRQILLDENKLPKYCELIKEIDQWEMNSIEKIKTTANDCRAKINNQTEQFFLDRNNQLNDIGQQLRVLREENQFNELDLEHFRKKFDQFQKQLDNLPKLFIEEQSSQFINEIFIQTYIKEESWDSTGLTVAGGNRLDQLSYPISMIIIDDDTFLISDFDNNRIIEWKSTQTNGRVIGSEQHFGPADLVIDKQTRNLIVTEVENRQVMQWFKDQDYSKGDVLISDIYCLGLAIDNQGFLYTTDYERNEIKRWKIGDQEGTIVAGGNGKGDQLNQLNSPTFIFVDDEQSVYVSDEKNHRVMKWTKDSSQGVIVAGGHGQGSNLSQLSFPQGLFVDHTGQIYVVDRDNQRVMCWSANSHEGKVIVGGNGKGQQDNQFNSPIHLSFDQQQNLYVVDHENHRIQKFEYH